MVRIEKTDDGVRVYLSPAEFQTWHQSADDDRAALAIRIMGRSSPRIGRTVRIRRGDFFIPPDSDVNLVFLRIAESKETNYQDHPIDGSRRITWVPWNLYQDIKAYCEAREIGADDFLFDIQAEQMRAHMTAAAENAAAKLEEPLIERARPHDARIFYATNMVRRLNVDKEIVKAMGDWNSDAAINPYLDVPLAKDMQTALARAGVVQREVPKPPRNTQLDALYEELHKLRDEVRELRAMREIEDKVTDVTALTVDRLEDLADQHLDPATGVDDRDKIDTGSTRSKSLESFVDNDLTGSDDGTDPAAATTLLGVCIWTVATAVTATKARLRTEIDDIAGEGPDPRSPAEYAKTGSMAVASVVLLGLVFAMVGVRIDPTTMTVHGPPEFFASSGIGVVMGMARVLTISD